MRTGPAQLPLHGGKAPAWLDRATYDRTIDVLRRALDRSRVDRSEKIAALKRLAEVQPPRG
jgi:hypothetical protein